MIVEALNQDEEAPWKDQRYGKDGMTIHKLKSWLGKHTVKPHQARQPGIKGPVRGYHYVDPRPRHKSLRDVLKDYAPLEEPSEESK